MFLKWDVLSTRFDPGRIEPLDHLIRVLYACEGKHVTRAEAVENRIVERGHGDMPGNVSQASGVYKEWEMADCAFRVRAVSALPALALQFWPA